MNNIETEHCVVCNSDTKVEKNTDVEYRMFYLRGVGQLCRYCWRAIQETPDTC